LKYSSNNTISGNSVSFGNSTGIRTRNSLSNSIYLNSICGNRYSPT